MTFFDEVTTKKQFKPNIVILLEGVYFRLREPDDAPLAADGGLGLISTLSLNPTTIDPFRPTTTISSYSFSLIDRLNKVSKIYADNGKRLQGAEVQIWLGRSGVGLPFASYYKLPTTYIAKLSKDGPKYNIQSEELRDRLPPSAFNTVTKLSSDIVPSTTVIPVNSTASFPSSGLFRIGKEIVAYSGKTGGTFTGLFRGTEGTDTLSHEIGSDVQLVTKLEGNALTLFLQLLISQGGGGTYDVLNQGAGIDPSLINLSRIENIRDSLFTSSQWDMRFYLGGTPDLRKFINEEILYPLNLRLRSDGNQISLAVLDRAFFDVDSPFITHANLTKVPTYEVNDNLVRNNLRISWGWSESRQEFLRQSDFEDAASITAFGRSVITEVKFKGIQVDLGGSAAVQEIADLFFNRFSTPRPSITAQTHFDAFFSNLGDKVQLETSTLPNDAGELAFADQLEVLSQAINVATGDIKFGLSFNSFTGVRSCFLAPSDTVASVISQSKITVGAGRGTQYRVGWKMRLYDNVSSDWVSPDQVNTITEISGDTITFALPWVETLDAFKRITFADYHDVVEQQKKYCFISDGTNNFTDGKQPYQILF